jgi:hypothetical protein
MYHEAKQNEMALVSEVTQPVVKWSPTRVGQVAKKRGKSKCPVSRKFRMPWSEAHATWASKVYLGV